MWIQLLCLVQALLVLTRANEPVGAAFSVRGHDIHLVTHAGLGSLVIDGVVDVKEMHGMFGQLWSMMLGLVSDVKTLNATVLMLQVWCE
jgi:hypothetical protein